MRVCVFGSCESTFETAGPRANGAASGDRDASGSWIGVGGTLAAFWEFLEEPFPAINIKSDEDLSDIGAEILWSRLFGKKLMYLESALKQMEQALNTPDHIKKMRQ